jgi:RnfABCDGE-type electron transport complex G subunit
VFVSVLLLTWTNSITSKKIEEQGDAAVLVLIRGIFPDMSRYTKQDDIFIIYDNENTIGYAFLATGQGYGGNISILVGLQDEATVKAIKIVSQSETPGLGGRITAASFTDQFNGLPINDVALTKNGGRVDAITGSTISSGAVVDAVRNTAIEKVKALQAKGG